MNAILSPVVSEFDTEEQAISHAAWVKAKVQASLEDLRPGIPHDQVMVEMEAILVEAESHHSALR